MTATGPNQLNRECEELVAAAARETDPERVAYIMEALFAALEQRERNRARTAYPIGLSKLD